MYIPYMALQEQLITRMPPRQFLPFNEFQGPSYQILSPKIFIVHGTVQQLKHTCQPRLVDTNLHILKIADA